MMIDKKDDKNRENNKRMTKKKRIKRGERRQQKKNKETMRKKDERTKNRKKEEEGRRQKTEELGSGVQRITDCFKGWHVQGALHLGKFPRMWLSYKVRSSKDSKKPRTSGKLPDNAFDPWAGHATLWHDICEPPLISYRSSLGPR